MRSTLEIHAPELIMGRHIGEGLRVRRCAPLLVLWTREASSLKDVPESARHGPLHARIDLLKPRLELSRSHEVHLLRRANIAFSVVSGVACEQL